jgi:hypothetical protein
MGDFNRWSEFDTDELEVLRDGLKPIANDYSTEYNSRAEDLRLDIEYELETRRETRVPEL